MAPIAGILPCAPTASISDVAVAFGLSDSADCYREIDALEAARVLEYVLHRDLAYNVEIMPLGLAIELTAEFIAQFSGLSARFFTNGDWGRPLLTQGIGHRWSPVTTATFDAGVVVVSTEKIGCVWCLDED